MQSRSEFIEAYWVRAMMVDEDMRSTASIVHKALWSESLAIKGRLDRSEWSLCDNTFWYFDQLAMKYAYDALGDRWMKRRPLLEAITLHIVLLGSIGEKAIQPLLYGDYTNYSFKMLNPGLIQGLERLQKNLEILRQRYYAFGKLPRSIDELHKPGKTFFEEGRIVWEYIRRSAQWDESQREDFAQKICLELVSLRKDWAIAEPRDKEAGTWIYEDLQTES